MQSTSDQLLFELKTRGPAETRDLSVRTGITRQATREHLAKLGAAGLVEFTRTASGVGRPGHTWRLTDKGHGRFPDTHAQITVEIIEAIRTEFGAEALSRLLARREQSLAERYEQALECVETLPERVELLARLRSAEGYMAEAVRQEDGTYVLVENHCPICAAATACQGFCRSELELFARLLAPARVARTEHLLAGCRRCSYTIIPSRR